VIVPQGVIVTRSPSCGLHAPQIRIVAPGSAFGLPVLFVYYPLRPGRFPGGLPCVGIDPARRREPGPQRIPRRHDPCWGPVGSESPLGLDRGHAKGSSWPRPPQAWGRACMGRPWQPASVPGPAAKDGTVGGADTRPRLVASGGLAAQLVEVADFHRTCINLTKM
jgi:hypothetical protein